MNESNTTRMLLVHYGADEYNPKLFRPISDREQWVKPIGGLWTSPVGSSWGWRQWCEAENFGTGALRSSFVVSFVGNLFVIDSVADMDRLPWVSREVPSAMGKSITLTHPSFEQLRAAGWDAVHLTVSGQERTRHTRPRNLYGWDCETVLVMNPESITAIPRPDADEIARRAAVHTAEIARQMGIEYPRPDTQKDV